MNLGESLAWLDRHQNLEQLLADRRLAVPRLDRMEKLMELLGRPQDAQPLVHITGTNGKTSTAWALSRLFLAQGLTVGTFTSPHLESINERIMANLEPVKDRDLADVLSDLAAVEPLMGQDRPSWFELMTAAAFRYFSDKPVDVAVVEVGMGGRWDASNVADAPVAVVTNVALDHTELLGPTRAHIAAEKAGIVKPGSILVLGETDPALYDIFAAEPADAVWLAGRDYAVESNRMAVGGRLVDLRTPDARYEEVFLPLHGQHQGDNFAAALAAAEAFFGRAVPDDILRAGAASVSSPGRMEIVRHHPLVVLDGAKNIAGAESSARALAEEIGLGRRRVMVVGMLGGKAPLEMLSALGAPLYDLVVACPPPSPRAQDAEVVAEAARQMAARAVAAGSVSEALDIALDEAGDEDLVVVTGSLYVVGAARALLAEDAKAAGRHR